MVDDNASFEQWYQQTHPRLAAALGHAFGDLSLAQDAADEAVARAFERWDSVSAMASPSGWLYTVGFNIAKRRVRRQRWETGFWRSERPQVQNAPAGELWILVASLPVRQRQAVALRHVGQLKEREIAEVMGITRGAVSSTLRSAYQTMRIELTEAPATQEMT